jgi:hypothetical protein
MDYRQITRLLGGHEPGQPPPLDVLGRQVADVWTSYQDSRFGRVTRDLPGVLSAAQLATREYDGDGKARALGLLALAYQAAAITLTKVGETDLAWTASDRGLASAERSGDPVVLGSLFRSVAHSLLSTGQYAAAIRLTEQAADYLRNQLAFNSSDTAPEILRLLSGPDHGRTSDDLLSVYGTLFLAGAMAAARAEDRHHPRVPGRGGHGRPPARQGR